MNLRPLLLVAFTLTACASSSDDDSTPSGSNSGTLDGKYSGTYTGDDTGPVTMTVSGTSVDVVATVAGTSYPGSGGVASNGGVSVGLGAGNGVTVTFEGTFASGKGLWHVEVHRGHQRLVVGHQMIGTALVR